jgi:hypothetical protein
MSTPVTLCPMCEKQAALTDPTYPKPKRLMDKLTVELPQSAGLFTNKLARGPRRILFAKLRR